MSSELPTFCCFDYPHELTWSSRHDPLERRPSLSQSSPAVAYGQPTILGLSCCLLSLTPASCVLMGWHHTTSASFLALLGSFYLLSGIGLMLAGELAVFGSMQESIPS